MRFRLTPLTVAWVGLLLLTCHYGGQELGSWLLHEVDLSKVREADWLMYESPGESSAKE